MSKLTGKVAVITGGSSGIGLATADQSIRSARSCFPRNSASRASSQLS